MKGYLKTTFLLAGMTAAFMGTGFLLGGAGGMGIAFCLALATNAFAYWNSGNLVLKMYNAKEITEQNDDTGTNLHMMVEQLAKNAGLPMPKVYIIDNPQPNAFATGRNPENAAVAATTGLLQQLNREQVAGVMAHELAHVKNRDTLTMTITATMAGAISALANFSLFFGGRSDRMHPIAVIGLALLAPLAAGIVQMAISRTREYEADRVGAEICGRPEWLASALEQIDTSAKQIHNHRAENNPATAHMFIINPLHMRRVDNLFSTHPATQERVRLLREMKL